MTPTAGPLAGKAAVVTGGSRGIGRAVVRRLAADGAAVVFSYLRDGAAAESTVDQVARAGGRAWAVQADQAEPDAVEKLFDAADRHFEDAGLGGLDILVNNAGGAVPQPIDTVTVDDYDRTMAVNARGVFLALQQAGRRLREGGRVVNVSTVSTAAAGPGEAIYTASKAAVEQFSRVASRELAPRGITVNTVSPGVTETDLLRRNAPEAALRNVASMTPLGRLGRPADIAAVVAFLAGDDAAWVTGQNIRADGGLL